MREREVERRRQNHELRTQPRPSPINAVVLVVVGALGVFAAAAAVMGSGYDDVTPHGQVLGDLSRVAEAQAQHYRDTGRFAEWIQSLGVPATDGVQVTVLRGDADEWEAIARHQMGLSCVQGGHVERGVPVRVEPTCFTPEP